MPCGEAEHMLLCFTVCTQQLCLLVHLRLLHHGVQMQHDDRLMQLLLLKAAIDLASES